MNNKTIINRVKRAFAKADTSDTPIILTNKQIKGMRAKKCFEITNAGTMQDGQPAYELRFNGKVLLRGYSDRR